MPESGSEALRGPIAEVVRGVQDLRDSYRQRAKWHRRWFRATGLIVIALSTTLPLMVIPDYGAKKVIISVVGVTIALLTGLRNFYQWDQLWSLLRQSDFELTFLLDRWKLDIQAAKGLGDPGQTAQMHKLTTALRHDAEEVRRAESTRYFGSLRFPSSSGG